MKKLEEYHKKTSKKAKSSSDLTRISENILDHLRTIEEVPDSMLGLYFDEELTNDGIVEQDKLYKKLAKLYDNLDKDINFTMGGHEPYWRHQQITEGLMEKMRKRTMTEKEYNSLKDRSVKGIRRMIKSKKFDYVCPTLKEIIAKLKAEKNKKQ